MSRIELPKTNIDKSKIKVVSVYDNKDENYEKLVEEANERIRESKIKDQEAIIRSRSYYALALKLKK